MDDKKNFIAFIVIFVMTMAVWDHFFAPQPITQVETHGQQSAQNNKIGQESIDESFLSNSQITEIPRESALNATERIELRNDKVAGSLSLVGARIDDISLLEYPQESRATQPTILFSPSQTANSYYAECGWNSVTPGIEVPNNSTVWHKDASSPNTIQWLSDQGVLFKQTFALDENYVISVTSSVENKSSKKIELQPFSRIVRTGTPEVGGFSVLHEGPIGYIDNQLQELDYDALKKASDKRIKSDGGWIGITDKYWLAAVIPDQTSHQEFFFKNQKIGNVDQYQTGCYGSVVALESGLTLAYKQNIFAGAKVLDILDGYEESLGVKHFDLAVDFGWFYFITKPFFYFLSFLNKYLGNFGLAILVMTVLLKLAFFPLANKSYRSMARMKELQPKMERIKEIYSNDKMKMNQELMQLYQKEKINPMAGCLPVLVQIPVFFALYKVLFVSIEMRHVPFYGWISDLAAKDPTNLFNLFGLIPWTPPSMLHIGVWPILMGLSMFIQQKLNPAPQDPIQAKMFLMMPVMLTVMMAGFPAGLVIYWTWSNILSIIQQAIIARSTKTSLQKQA